MEQAADLHSNRLSQQLVINMLKADACRTRISSLRKNYQNRRDVINEHLTRHFSDLATLIRPCGGLFFWLTLKAQQAVDTRKLLPAALEKGVVFMPGEPFFADERAAASALRLNFSHAEPEEVEKGLVKLAEITRRTVSTS